MPPESHLPCPPRLGALPPEALLKRHSRAGLSFWDLCCLYLSPCPLFRDSARGDIYARRLATEHNLQMRRYLPIYLQRWFFISALGMSMMMAFEPIMTHSKLAIAPVMAGGILFAIAVSFFSVILAAWVLLSNRPQNGRS